MADRYPRAGSSGPRTTCRYCGGPLPHRRRTFCSDNCVNEHRIRSDPSFQAKRVLERDHGICENCGLDTIALLERLGRTLDEASAASVTEYRCVMVYPRQRGRCGHAACLHDCARDYSGHVYSWVLELPDYRAACDAAALPKHLRHLKRRLWEMDHRTPCVEGGNDCGLDNLRTLCWACHRAETAALAARRAAARKAR